MKKEENQTFEDGTVTSRPTSSDLRGRQSVRATFRLSGKAIDAISVVASHLGIKQKSLFDHLIDNMESLNHIAREIQSDHFNRLDRVQKTYVLSRKTLYCLEKASKNFDTPRDALVEYSIQRLLPIIDEERDKHEKRKHILNEITEYMSRGEQLLAKSKKMLGEDDPVYQKFETAMRVTRNAHYNIESFVEKGKVIEDF